MSAVVTGLGIVAPNGVGVDEYWRNTLAGVSGIGPISRFDGSAYPTSLAGEVTGFEPLAHLPRRLVVQTDRWTQFALVAAETALSDASALPLDETGLGEYDMAVVTASSSGGNEFGQGELGRLWRLGPDHVTTFQSIAWFYAATTGQLSIRHGMRGPCGVVVSEQAGGLDAIGQALRVIRDGTKLALTGGTEAPLSPYALVCLQTSKLLSTATDPTRAYVPFDIDAAGFVPGEGGAILVVEDEDSARARPGVFLYGRVVGYAATFDPPPGSGRPPALRRAAELALARAGCEPGDIDVVFADAAGVPEADRAEAEAIAGLFGEHGVPVTAPKTMTGRLFAGGGSLDAATALLALRDGVIPPTAGVDPAAAYRLDLVVGTPREAPLRTALVLARGFGGFNSALVLQAM
ncbi:ketosynthase chain-length factor [Streptomyces canus]|uniref:Act minimal PKS chain-length factor (CLF/KS beta) n=1 Tax=Streptomyces canus TaxID=58343 RepID=A0AAW8FIN4_9ACTN|nr:ketosynthase chain-length factor [Streptomyces canus]MDQ0762626.1 act minimal PKS chain-length factor (CLF/KS beta) [Streptomyces canus]MDQ0908902.1 act minimal PKS chain-length factor (CLF/KS beta) [Streptomyces canus]MDQ1068930.1 act minimal PKS chain-length factor (CLF/KS beta) [Streptomyces canus]